jgi:hypothetical protein
MGLVWGMRAPAHRLPLLAEIFCRQSFCDFQNILRRSVLGERNKFAKEVGRW